jgi:hypothetical protein
MQIKTALRFHLTSYHQENKRQQMLVRMEGEKGTQNIVSGNVN